MLALPFQYSDPRSSRSIALCLSVDPSEQRFIYLPALLRHAGRFTEARRDDNVALPCRNHPRERHLPNFPVRIKRRAAISHRKPVYFCVTISHAVLTRLLFASRILLTFHTRVEIYLSLPRDEIRSPRYDFLLLARMERNKRNNWKEKRLFSNRGGEKSRHYGAETRNRRRWGRGGMRGIDSLQFSSTVEPRFSLP